MSLIIFLVVGLLAGLLARAIVPGKDSMGILPTMLLGIVGSFVGGMIGALFSSNKDVLEFNTSGLILSVIGAIIALLVYNRVAGRKNKV